MKFRSLLPYLRAAGGDLAGDGDGGGVSTARGEARRGASGSERRCAGEPGAGGARAAWARPKAGACGRGWPGRGRCGLAWGGTAAEIGWRRRRRGSAGGVECVRVGARNFFYRKKPPGGCFVGPRLALR